MALTNRSDVAPIFLSIIGGKITQKVKEGVEGAVSRVNKKNETVWELQFDNLTGILKSVEIKENEYQGKKLKSWEFTISDAGEVYRLQTPFSGRVTNGILTRLPNIDLGAPIEIKTYYMEEKTYAVIHQNGSKVQPAYTKENPNGLPPLEKKTIKGEEVWDDTEQINFLKNMVFSQIVPKLNQLNAAKPAAPSAQDEPEWEEPTGEDSDGLPF